MAGTKAGGQAAAATNKKKYGADFYVRMGAVGGKLGRTGGFYSNRELARVAGAKGGRASRRVWTDEQRQALSKTTSRRLSKRSPLRFLRRIYDR